MQKVLMWIATLLLVALVIGVTGCGSSEDDAEASREPQNPASSKPTVHEALTSYEWYLNQESARLVELAEQLEKEVTAGRQFNSTFRYATSRVHYGHIRPAAELFPALNARINDSDFHQLEYTLFKEQSAKGLDATAVALVADVRKLGSELRQTELQPVALAKATERLLRIAAGKMVAGKEEPYALNSMVDISASAEGSEATFKALIPLLAKKDPGLVRKTEDEFKKAFDRIDEHGEPARNAADGTDGTFFITYNYLSPREKEEMRESFENLERLFREAAVQLQGS